MSYTNRTPAKPKAAAKAVQPATTQPISVTKSCSGQSTRTREGGSKKGYSSLDGGRDRTYALIDQLREHDPVEAVCSAFDVATSSYYDYRQRRKRIDTERLAPARVVQVFGCTTPHCAYLFAMGPTWPLGLPQIWSLGFFWRTLGAGDSAALSCVDESRRRFQESLKDGSRRGQRCPHSDQSRSGDSGYPLTGVRMSS